MPPRFRIPAEEQAFLTAISDQPEDPVTRLVYADWLEERGRGLAGEFLRLKASIPVMLMDGDSPTERQELTRQLAVREKLRTLRKELEPAWLSATDDPGLVGEIVVWELNATANTVVFGIIIKETPKTVVIEGLRQRIVKGDSQDGLVRPVIEKRSESLEPMTAKKISDGRFPFVNIRQSEFWQFWDGKDHADYGD